MGKDENKDERILQAGQYSINLKHLESLASRGLNYEQIAGNLGMCDKTLRKLRNEYSEISEAIKIGKAKGIGQIANALFQKAASGDTTSMIFFLKTQAGWRETDRVEHSGVNGGAINIESSQQFNMENLTDDELRTIITLSNKASTTNSSTEKSN